MTRRSFLKLAIKVAAAAVVISVLPETAEASEDVPPP